MVDLNAVVVSGLRKVYGSVKAVDNLDLRVESGQVFGMLGPNGAGKTTTVEILVGLRSRDAGEVSIMGLDPARQAREVKSRIGVQLQTHGLYPRLTVRELVCLFASFYKNPLPPDEVIERVGLAAKARTIVKALSGGQVQRLAVALAMVNDAELVFLDEPTTGLMAADREKLELLPGVTRTRFDGDRATLYTRDIPRTIAGLMELAEGNGVTIGDVTVRRSTLEDVFLKLTGRRIRE